MALSRKLQEAHSCGLDPLVFPFLVFPFSTRAPGRVSRGGACGSFLSESVSAPESNPRPAGEAAAREANLEYNKALAALSPGNAGAGGGSRRQTAGGRGQEQEARAKREGRRKP